MNLSEAWSEPGRIAAVAAELGLNPRDSGGRIAVTCPACGAPEAWIYKPAGGRPPMVRCNRRSKCGAAPRPLFDLYADHLGGKAAALDALGASPSRPSRPRRIVQEPSRPPELVRPPRAKVEALWAAGVPLTEENHPLMDSAREKLRVKCGGHRPSDIAELGLAKLLPDPKVHRDLYTDWLPASWAMTWPLMVRMFDAAAGGFASLHLRSVRGGPKSKAMSPKGLGTYGYGGLVMADATGQAWLRGEIPPEELEAVAIVEGVWHFLWAAASYHAEARRVPVIGVISGSVAPGALAAVRRSEQTEVWAMTHSDDAGDKYAEAIRAVVPRRVPVRRKAMPND